MKYKNQQKQEKVKIHIARNHHNMKVYKSNKKW